MQGVNRHRRQLDSGGRNCLQCETVVGPAPPCPRPFTLLSCLSCPQRSARNPEEERTFAAFCAWPCLSGTLSLFSATPRVMQGLGSLARVRSCAPCVEAQGPNRWTAREAPFLWLVFEDVISSSFDRKKRLSLKYRLCCSAMKKKRRRSLE